MMLRHLTKSNKKNHEILLEIHRGYYPYKDRSLKQHELQPYANQYENAVENVHFIMHGIISRRKHTFEVCVMEACAI